MTYRIAVVDDDVHIRNIVEGYLQSSGYRTIGLRSTEEALELLEIDPPDLWIIDVMLPGEDGYSLCKRIRTSTEIPIVMISALTEDEDRITGIDLGADDFMSKPFSPKELVARVNRLMHRHELLTRIGSTSPLEEKYSSLDRSRLSNEEGLRFNEDDNSIVWRGVHVGLTAKEFSLLQYLFQYCNQACSREDIITQIWGSDSKNGDHRALDQVVKRLRKKLSGLTIDTVWGYGYRLRLGESKQ